jgi:adenine/guanine/hypoxanthine permease
MAPGMGLNAYFTYTVVKGMGLAWQTALGCVFISGIAFLLRTVAGVRQLIVSAVPRSLFAAVAGGVGLFIAFIGLSDAGIIVAKQGTMVGLGSLTTRSERRCHDRKTVLAELVQLRTIGVVTVKTQRKRSP